MEEQENREDSFLDNCYERAFVIYSYDKNLHLAHLQNSNMPLKDFLRSYKVKMRELGDEEVIYHIWEKITEKDQNITKNTINVID